jgi:uncharacterized paraquat-inducible protein A
MQALDSRNFDPMLNGWFYFDGEEEQGLYTKDDMVELILQGVILADTAVRLDHEDEWSMAANAFPYCFKTSNRRTTCPACQAYISKRDPDCPHCGEPLHARPRPADPTPSPKRIGWLKPLVCVLIILVAVYLLRGWVNGS